MSRAATRTTRSTTAAPATRRRETQRNGNQRDARERASAESRTRGARPARTVAARCATNDDAATSPGPAVVPAGTPGSAGAPVPTIVRADARALPLADDSVDLVVTSPPYFGLRSYQDDGRHYEGQIGSETTPQAYLDALLEVTRECVRVLKPTGSIMVNLGDRYATSRSGTLGPSGSKTSYARTGYRDTTRAGRAKTLLGLPWRYAIRCMDELGLILRAEIVWAKPNGLPESVSDRVRRSHETWFHFTLQPRYYAAVDAIRQTYTGERALSRRVKQPGEGKHAQRAAWTEENPFGRLPGSVWEIPTQPLRAPAELGIDHYAAFPMELPRRLILGWCPREVCTVCGHGRRPVVHTQRTIDGQPAALGAWKLGGAQGETSGIGNWRYATTRRITGSACACPDTTAPTKPGVVLDPFGGTGTTALVAVMHGREGISVDASADYCRLAEWRARDPRQRAKAAQGPTAAALRAQPPTGPRRDEAMP
jgi:DNA modification methylase